MDANVEASPLVIYKSFRSRLVEIARGVAYEFNDMPFTQAQIDAICEEHPDWDDLPYMDLKWMLEVHYHSLKS